MNLKRHCTPRQPCSIANRCLSAVSISIPRSASINTEAGLYVESPELAEQVAAYMDEGVQPQNSYRVLLDADGDLVWVTRINGREVRYHKEPESSFGQRFMSGFIQLLPVEHQL